MSGKIISYHDFIPRLNKFKEFIYVKDLKNTLKKLDIQSTGKKSELLDKLIKFYSNLYNYEKDINKILKIQALAKGKFLRKKMKYRGPGFLNKNICTNDEDFCTFENIHDIDDLYFFSYKDIDGFVYYFDIRSFKKLCDKTKENPYNRNPIPKNVIYNMNSIINDLKKMNISIDHEEAKLSPEQEYNSKVLNIFQKIDELNAFAGGTDVNWFHNLSFNKLKHFYKVLEDIWNYRSELNEKQKRDIVPNNDVFKHSMSKVMNMNISQHKKLKNIILDEIDKLISSSNNDSHKATGCYYVLIGLVEVCPECANHMPWLVQTSFIN